MPDDQNRPRTSTPETETRGFPIDVDKLDDSERRLPPQDGLDGVWHRFEAKDLHAINAAIAAERPLLLRGEPGTGKSQLARAAAWRLGRRLRWKVVDNHTEVSDLFYTFDAVARLAYAQILGAVTKVADEKGRCEVLAELDVGHFLRPGPLWWAFEEKSAEIQESKYLLRCGRPRIVSETPGEPGGDDPKDPRRGWVVLIDEIDKADPSVPNGLLEALGQGTFEVLGGEVISLHRAAERAEDRPLVIITTNEERELPSAFVRRCMVHTIEIPGDRGDEPEAERNRLLQEWLEKRGETHVKDALPAVLTKTAEMVITDRRAAQRLGVTPPGQAEYLDLLRAVTRLGRERDEAYCLELLNKLGDYALKKHPDQRAGERR